MIFKVFPRVNKSTERPTDSTGKRKLEMTLHGSLLLSSSDGAMRQSQQPQHINTILEAEKRLIRAYVKDYFHFYVYP